MSKLFDKLRANTVIDKKILEKSNYWESENFIPFDVPILNLAISGSFDKGLPAGIVMIAAPPKHFKTNLMIQAMKSFQRKYKDQDNLIIFYDSEFGSPNSYFEGVGIDIRPGENFDRRPIFTVEQWKSDLANLVTDIEVGDKVLICVDSIGMLASAKEVEDAKNENDKADFTRAKALKSVFRIANGQINFKGITCIVINHSYQTMDMFPEEKASGGRGAEYAGHTLWNIGKRQKKVDSELTGFDFVLKSKFSRYVREKSDFPVTVSFDDGISKYSGIFDLALETKHIYSEKQGWYKLIGNDKVFRRKELEETDNLMQSLVEDASFKTMCNKMFALNPDNV